GRDKNTYYVFLLNGISSKSGLAGYMPLKEQYAFIHSVSNSKAAQLIAHELGHGAFRLWHTFSSNSQYTMPEKTSDNLMDYNNGTRLHAWQWKNIHNPKAGLYMFQKEEEGEMKTENDLITDVIGKLRCAKASNKNKIFIGSNGRYISGKNKTPDFFVELYLNKEKNRYDYYNLNLSYKKTEYNHLKNKYNFGTDLYLLIRKKESSIFETYINKSDFSTEYNKVSKLIASNKESDAIDELYNYSYCIYEKLTSIERKKLLLEFANKSFLPENYEDMVLNLLRSSYSLGEKDAAKAAINAIFNNRVKRGIMGQLTDKRERSLFEVLSSGMDDFNGKSNYSEWIKELTNLFTIAYSEELKKGRYPDLTLFPNNMIIKNTTPYYFYNWDYVGGSEVSLNLDKYSLNLVNGTKKVRPNDIINVRFGRNFEFVPQDTKPVIAMPAFCLVYLLNHEQSKLKANVAKYIISAINIYNASRQLVITQGSKVLATLALLKEVADPVFDNDDFKTWAMQTLDVPEDFFVAWDYLNTFDITKANANSIVGLVTKQNWFGTFYNNWKLMIANQALSNKITQSKVDELNKAIEDVKNHLDNENIVY
ncbi:MAG: hypothetical protein MI739_06525, partial [Bacteroidales bacterium]|nr:hypothetical protein [Bacteroidales bacterium]